jgi:hypothetical protein
MRPSLRYDLVDTPEKFNDMKRFAATFNHHIDDTTRLPIVRVFRGDQQVAYFQIIKTPMAAPAFHDNLCSPRDTCEIIDKVRSHMLLGSLGGRTPNGECLIILPERLRGGFTKPLIEKMGFIDLGQKIWQSLG